MKKSLLDKVVIVTGGANGLGKVFVKEFCNQGAKVVIADIDVKKGSLLAKKLSEKGFNCIFIELNLLLKPSCEELIKKTIFNFKQIDVIINNAKPKINAKNLTEDLNQWDNIMTIMVKSPLILINEALPFLKKTSACIINIGSTNAFTISHQPASYHVAKAALIQLTKFIAYNFGSFGIRANNLCPALIDIVDNGESISSNKTYNKIIKTMVPLQRAANPKEIANTVIFLCSDKAKYITGQTIIVDGGAMLGDSFHNTLKGFQRGNSK